MLEKSTRYTCTFDYEKDGIEYRANIKGRIEPPQNDALPFVKRSIFCNGISDAICSAVMGVVRGGWVVPGELELMKDQKAIEIYYVRIENNLYPITINIDTEIINQGVFNAAMLMGTDL